MRFWNYLLDVVFPPICRTCREVVISPEDTAGICSRCQKDIVKVEPPYCDTCGIAIDPAAYSPGAKTCEDCPTTKIFFHKARASFEYYSVIATLIKAFKFRGKTDILPFFVEAIDVTFRKDFFEDPIDVIVPVPLHWTRHWRREFNQSEMLAQGLSQMSGIPCVSDTLKRIRRTKSQSKLKRIKRLANLKNAFAVKKPETISGKNVLLVDDVYTTGTTVNECSRVLMEAGAENVCVLTVARAGRTTGGPDRDTDGLHVDWPGDDSDKY